MKAAFVALALALVPATAIGGDYRNPTPGKDVALQISGMHLVKVRRNLVYTPGLRLDVYRPRTATEPVPAVLFVHGRTSAESPKDWGQYVGWGQLAAASGLAGVTFNHYGEPADIVAAIRYVRANASRLGIDAKRLCVASFSAGVHPTLLTALEGKAGKLSVRGCVLRLARRRPATALAGHLSPRRQPSRSRRQGGRRRPRHQQLDRPLCRQGK